MIGETAEERRRRVLAELAADNPKLHDHLFGNHPKRILALDGGGVLGVIEIAFLERIEEVLRQRFDDPRLVLADYFDLIGGTSTGAIVATGLAMGMTAKQLKDHYFELARDIFRRPRQSVPGLEPKFDARILMNKLRVVFGERQLQSSDLETGLAIVSKRVDTGSPWVLTNNPMSRYWFDPEIAEGKNRPDYIGNKVYKLRDLVRASTAAPFYYSPKSMQVVVGEPHGLFVDGGLTPHNNPALQMLMLASIRGYGFWWPVTADDLMMISVGSGWMRPRINSARLWDRLTGPMAIKTLRSLIWDGQVNTLKILQWISEPRLPWPINSEVGTLVNEFLGVQFGERQELLKFQRYDVMLDHHEEHQKKFGPEVSKAVKDRLNDFMNPAIMGEAYDLASECAAIQVNGDDFPPAFNAGVGKHR